MNSKQTVYTDYPLVELGDTPKVKAPIRPCRVLEYDGDKYIWVEIIGIPNRRFHFKRFYIYPVPCRLFSKRYNKTIQAWKIKYNKFLEKLYKKQWQLKKLNPQSGN